MKQTKRQSWPIAAAFLMSLGLSLKAQVNVLPTPEMVDQFFTEAEGFEL